MSEKENDSQSLKTKICKLGRWSLVLGVIGFVSAFVLTLFTHGPGAVLSLLIGFAGFILGIAALVKIRQSGGLLKGKIVAIFGILSCIVGQILGIYFAGAIFFYAQKKVFREICSENLKALSNVMQVYSSNSGGRYPTPDGWCDLITEYGDVEDRHFRCRWAGKERCYYAMNPNCEPNSPADMVLLFETKGGWNQFGGPEILTTENHNGKGCNVLFNDGHIEFVKKEQLGQLKWKAEDSEKLKGKSEKP